jgi:c-di-GMP-binding flagellar brake protein YcgR
MEKFADRRKWKRVPITANVANPMVLQIPSPEGERTIPAIIINLSAGGMCILSFLPVEVKEPVKLNMEINGIKMDSVKAKIAWIREKSGTYLLGLEFCDISRGLHKRLNAMAEDYFECEKRILKGQGYEACHSDCSFWSLCTKTIRIKRRS